MFYDVDYKKNGKLRIVCLGDLTTFVMGVSYYESYPYLLNCLLNEKFPNKEIQVLNAGIPGARSMHIKRFFQKYIVKYNADIVIWRRGFSCDDTFEIPSLSSSSAVRYFLWLCIYKSTLFRCMDVLLQKTSLGIRMHLSEIVYHLIMYNRYIFSEDICEGPINTEYNSDFNMVKAIAIGNDAKAVIALDYLIYDGKNKKVQSNYSEYNEGGKISSLIKIVNSFNNKLKKFPVKYLFIDDHHLTKNGNQIIAQEILNFIIQFKYINLFK